MSVLGTAIKFPISFNGGKPETVTGTDALAQGISLLANSGLNSSSRLPDFGVPNFVAEILTDNKAAYAEAQFEHFANIGIDKYFNVGVLQEVQIQSTNLGQALITGKVYMPTLQDKINIKIQQA